jgi:hypothetical protein
MIALALAVALIALGVSVLTLLIVLGAVRRMRTSGWIRSTVVDGLPPIGLTVPSFRFLDTSGNPIDSNRLGSGRHALAFVSSACDACHDSVPQWVALADKLGAERSLAVLLDDSEDPALTASMLRRLTGASTVLVEAEGERGVGELLGVASFPTFLGVQDGVVRLSSHRTNDLVRWHDS